MSDANLVITDGTSQSLVPARQLVLTRAPQLSRLPALTSAVSEMTDLTVDNFPHAKSLLTEIRTVRKQTEQHHALQKAPLNEVRTFANSLENEDVSAFKALETVLSARVLAFTTDLERRQREEQDRLRREAEEKARADAKAKSDALRSAARSEDDPKARRQLHAQARVVEASPVFVPVVKVTPPVETVSTRTTWTTEITDIRELVKAVADGRVPLAALEPDRLVESHPWLNTQAVQLREEFRVPGVVAIQKKSLSGR